MCQQRLKEKAHMLFDLTEDEAHALEVGDLYIIKDAKGELHGWVLRDGHWVPVGKAEPDVKGGDNVRR